MPSYDLELAPSTIALARRDGFVLGAAVVRSALGVPFSTGLSPTDYAAYVARVVAIAASSGPEN